VSDKLIKILQDSVDDPTAPAEGQVTMTRGEKILDYIYDDVDQRLNPNGDECWYCGGEGATYDCIDGYCVDAESGCADCERPCIECKLYAGQRSRAVREEVIKTNDVEVAVAWLKHIGRWHDGITEDQVKEQLAGAASLVSSHMDKST
jgi:hypothetical protein